MFNNPFDSFHNTVAEAKEERERLDRLLTISTPRERLLVIGVAVLLLVLAAWLLLGGVARTVGVVGVLAAPDGTVSGGKASLEALIWVDRDTAPGLAPGMRAVVEVAGADGGTATLGGQIATIAAVPYSGTLAGFGPTAPVSVHRVAITLDEGAGFQAAAGTECRITIELGRQSPVTVFGTRHP